MNASMLWQRSWRWLVGIVIAASIAAAALAIPQQLTDKPNAVFEAPALAGPVIDPGGGGG